MAEIIQKPHGAVCPFCPFRSWPRNRIQRVLAHVRQHHSRRKQFVASGTKQMKLVIALHDQDQCERKQDGQYLSRSAKVMRESLDETVSKKIMDLDRHMRLVLTHRGPEYWSLQAVQEAALRRVRNQYYTREFALLLFKELLMCDAKARRPKTLKL